MRIIARFLTHLGTLSARPLAFFIVLLYVAAWMVFSPHTFEWHAVATIVTLLMTLVIQRSEHRDTQAIHAKLDELLRVDIKASSELASIDEKQPEEIERIRGRRASD